MRVVAVVVAYHPAVPRLVSLCRALREQGATVVIVDNSEEPVADLAQAGLAPLGDGVNRGIAAAQNRGIARALELGAEAIAFFDQDSAIGPGFVAALTAPLQPGRPGVAAAVYQDERDGFEYPSYRLTRLGWPVKVYARGRTAPFLVDLVISSGSVATAPTFAVAGTMDERLFIDFVDLEWCLRCRRAGVPIWIAPAALLHHSIGQRSVRLGVARGFIHGPERSYYKLRNPLLLLRRREVPSLYAWREVASALFHALGLLPFVRRRGSYLTTYLRAVADGLRGRDGPRAG